MQDQWQTLLLLLLGAVAVIVVQSWRLSRQSAVAQANQEAARREEARRVAAHARSARAGEGEQGAHALLQRAGYDVLEHQAEGAWTVRADGEPVTFGLRADYLVAREGRRYVAEVKTGRLAPRLSHAPTRRQLLEYGAAFDVHGVLLVDADAESVTHVEWDVFARKAEARSSRDGSALSARIVAVLAVLCFTAGVVAGTVINK